MYSHVTAIKFKIQSMYITPKSSLQLIFSANPLILANTGFHFVPTVLHFLECEINVFSSLSF